MKTVTAQTKAEIHEQVSARERPVASAVTTLGTVGQEVNIYQIVGSLRFELRRGEAVASVDFLPVLEAIARELREEEHLG